MTLLPHGGQALQHVRLEGSDWNTSGHGADVVVEGIDAALPLFGLRHLDD